MSKKPTEEPPSLLSMFKLGYEYDLTCYQARKAIKKRTIKNDKPRRSR